jgi:hypothetical protein
MPGHLAQSHHLWGRHIAAPGEEPVTGCLVGAAIGQVSVEFAEAMHLHSRQLVIFSSTSIAVTPVGFRLQRPSVHAHISGIRPGRMAGSLRVGSGRQGAACGQAQHKQSVSGDSDGGVMMVLECRQSQRFSLMRGFVIATLRSS